MARAVVADHSRGGATGASPQRRARTLPAPVLFDSGHADFGGPHSADPTSTKEQLIAAAAGNSEVDSWDELVELLRAEGLDRRWMLVAWHEGR